MAKILVWVDWVWRCDQCPETFVEMRNVDEEPSTSYAETIAHHLQLHGQLVETITAVAVDLEHHYALIPAVA